MDGRTPLLTLNRFLVVIPGFKNDERFIKRRLMH